MKLRIKGNSVRLRLSKTDISNFEKNNVLNETTEFINGKFFYELKSTTETKEIVALYDNNKISVIIPQDIANNWTESDLITLKNEYEYAADKSIFILIEKDFVCLDNTHEDQSDNFPNPNAACGPTAI